MTREDILKKAKECVCGQREQDYGTPEDSFACIAALWETYLMARHPTVSHAITIRPEDVATMMALLKIARIAGRRGSEDSWIDLAGYAACGGEIAYLHEHGETPQHIPPAAGALHGDK